MYKIAIMVTVFVVSFYDLSFAAEVSVQQKTRSKAVMMNEQELKSFLLSSSDLEMTDKYGFTSLFSVALNRDSEILKMWIKSGANVKAISNAGSTPLFFAAVSNQLDSIELLVQSGVNVNHRKKNGDNVLHYAIERPGMVRAETVIKLINLGADVNALDSDGKSPLHLLRERKDFLWEEPEKAIEISLIRKGAKDISGFQNQNENKILGTTSPNGTKLRSKSDHHFKEVSQSNCSTSDKRKHQNERNRWASDSECSQQENYNPMK